MREAFTASGQVLVVTQKAVRQHWETCGHTPGNVDYAHHNAVAGIDRWGGVQRLVVVGRTLPRPGDVERLAEALTGAAVVQRVSRYERRDSAIQLADGSSVTAEVDFHPDPVAEAIRWQICEGELIQIIGRGRGSSRSAAKLLDVLVLTDRPLPLEVQQAVTWESLRPSPLDLMLSQTGVAVLNASDASKCFPHLWGTPAAARQALHRARSVTNPFKEYLYKGNVTLLQATYQVAGAGQKPAKVIFDSSRRLDLHGWLEDRVGELARLQLDEPSPEPDPDPIEPGVGADEAEADHSPHASAPGA
jgi:putative DNA primase/helicase